MQFRFESLGAGSANVDELRFRDMKFPVCILDVSSLKSWASLLVAAQLFVMIHAFSQGS